MKPSGAVLLAAAVLFVWNTWGYDLWAPDEPYFAEGAREMVIDGEWAVPHVNGRITTDKPPLFFWLIAVFSLPLGQVVSFTARLPSVLASLGTLALTMRLGRRRLGESSGVLAGFLLTSCYLFWDKSRSAQIDALLCFLILASLSAFDSFRAGEARGSRAGLLFWLAAALAVLAKGPVGFLLPLGIALLTLAIDRDLGAWRRFAPVGGPLLFALIVIAWGVMATLGSGGEYSVWGALREHFVERAVRGMHHPQPPWYYLTVLPFHLQPWAGLVPGAILLAWRRRRRVDRFLLVACLFVVLFFSVSTEKRDLYVLPAYPAFALLVAGLVSRATREARRTDDEGTGVSPRWIDIPQGLLAVLLLAVGIALPLGGGKAELVPVVTRAVLGATLACGGILTLWAMARGQRLRSVLFPAAALAAAYLVLSSAVFPVLDTVKSSRAFARKIVEVTASSRAAGNEVLAYRLGNLPEAFAFYSDGVYCRETQDPAQLESHLQRPGPVYAVADAAGLDAMSQSTRRRIKVLASTRLSRKDVVLVVSAGADPSLTPGHVSAPRVHGETAPLDLHPDGAKSTVRSGPW